MTATALILSAIAISSFSFFAGAGWEFSRTDGTWDQAAARRTAETHLARYRDKCKSLSRQLVQIVYVDADDDLHPVINYPDLKTGGPS